MKIKFLKKLAGKLSRNEGISLTPIIAIMVIMSIMGGVFTSIMGNWKVSAPVTINSSKAYYLAETAAMFALQDAKNRFFSVDNTGTPSFPSTTTGTRAVPYVVSSSSTESSEYWIERPYLSTSPHSTNSAVDLDRGNNDDAKTLTDDDIDDDDDDDNDTLIYGNPTDVSSPSDSFSDVYTIIATGKVKRAGVVVAKRQVKIKATIVPNTNADVAPGVHTEGAISGTGPPNNSHFDMDNPTSGANVTYGNGDSLPLAPTSPGGFADENGIVYRDKPNLDSEVFKAMAIDQGHYHASDFPASDDYPNGSYYYSGSVPNIVYVDGNLTINGNKVIYGVYWITGNTTVFNGNYQVNGIIICEGDLTMNGGGSQTPNMDGGIIQYGTSSTLTGNGNPVDIDINEQFFTDMNNALPIVRVVSSQEAVSAN